MKRSPYISLVLLSTLSLTACNSEVPGNRSQYSSIADCIQDWGDADECEKLAGDNGFLGPAVVYDDYDRKHFYKSKKHGKLMPSFANASFANSLATRQSKAIGQLTSSVKVGGFGSSAGFHGASS